MRITLISLLAIVSLAAKPAFSNAEELNFENLAIDASQDATNGDIAIDETNFPDAIFRNWILQQYYGMDGKLTESEIKEVTSIAVYEKNISTLKGIELFTSLNLLNCSSNQLTSLDISKNTALTFLYCDSNQLTFIDVSKNTALTWLECGSNQLTTLDLSKNTALYYLDCHSNQLSSLDVSQNPSLRTFYCHRNQINGKAMDDLISSMPYNSTGKIYGFLVVSTADDDEGNVCTKSQVAAAKAKGWTPVYWDGSSWLEYEGSEDSSQEKGDPILITHIPDSYDIINDVTYDISEYDAMKLDGILNEYMADENRGENQEFYLEGGKNYYIGSFLSTYKGFTLQTNPADLAAGKGRAKIYLGGLCKQGESYVNYANFMLGRVPFDGEDETMTLDIDSIRFIDLDFDVPLATNYGQAQETLGYATGNYFMNMYSMGLGVNLTTLEWRNCSFQGLIRGVFRIQGFNNKNIHHIRMIGCDFYNCGYYSQNGRDYGYFFGDHSGLEKSNIFEDIEVAECVFYNSPKSPVVTDNNRNVEWDESVRWHINLHHNTFVNLSTLSNNPILNTRYIPGGSVLEFHDNIIINTKDANDVNRTMYCAGWDARTIQGGDGSGQATFNLFNNWTTNDEEYLVDGQPFTANAFNAAWNSPGVIISNGQGICPAGTDELVVHLEETLRATDMMESPNPPYFIGESPKGTDFHTDKGIDGLYYKQTPDVLNSAIYKSGAGASKLRNPVLKKGDVNADGEVGIGDIITITNVMAGDGTEAVIKRADVNGDGEVGIGDIISITNIMAGE